jgi:sec-independent protein translocase protein TatA
LRFGLFVTPYPAACGIGNFFRPSEKFLAMFNAMNPGSILLIALVVLLLFGGKKIPELMKGLGRGVKEFKDATNSDEKEQDGSEG